MMADFLFLTFASAAVISALLVVTRRNPVASVMFLIVTFFSLSGMFLLMDAHFIAAVQVIIYAGAIMVLFLFVIMLLNLGQATDDDLRGPTAMLVGGTLIVALILSAVRALVSSGAPSQEAAGPTVAETFGPEALEAMTAARGAVGVVADPLFRNYLVPFELTSLLLLVAIIGAIALARRREP